MKGRQIKGFSYAIFFIQQTWKETIHTLDEYCFIF